MIKIKTARVFLYPIFSSPAGEHTAPIPSRPVDMAYLSEQTGCDRTLEEEVLQLFLKQAAKLCREIGTMSNKDAVRQAAHQVKGAARAVGAFAVAESAQKVEAEPSKKQSVRALVNDLGIACDYISSLLR